MRGVFLILGLHIICFSTISAQQNQQANIRKGEHSSGFKWIQAINQNLAFSQLNEIFNLDANHQLQIIKQDLDQIGMEHFRIQHLYNNIPVDGSQIILHTKAQLAQSVSGSLADGNFMDNGVHYSSDQAIEIAKQDRNAKAYAWEQAQSTLGFLHTDLEKSGLAFPKAQLVWFSPNDDEVYTLCYKIDLFSFDPHVREWVYVDAANANIVKKINQICEINVVGQAQTKFLGLQTIIVDSLAPDKFVLRDNTRGNGIITLNAQSSTKLENAVDFEDADNFWNNVNLSKDEIATDAHFGTQSTYDYYKKVFNRNSIDDKGYNLISLVHYDRGWNNASWNGTTMNYGDGDGSTFNPFTFLDVCGHEVTHGLTSNTSNLVYLNESGALNESISDILGVSMKQWRLKKDTTDWSVGQGLYKSNSKIALRDMSNPNKYQNPKYYKGSYWEFTAADNGGVHTNSGVLNYWYYLIAQGGKGSNEAARSFNVKSIGLEKAEQLVYRMNTYYLNPKSNYKDAVAASILVAEDLFGSCSPELESIFSAWYAVGLSDNTGRNQDLYYDSNLNIASSCYLTDQEKISYRILYQSCIDKISSGNQMNYGIIINDTLKYINNLTLNNDLEYGDEIKIDFPISFDFSNVGKYKIKMFHHFSNDPNPENDTLSTIVEKYSDDKSDHSLRSISIQALSFGCTSKGPLRGLLITKYGGCDSLSAGTEIPVGISVNNVISTGLMKIEKTIYRGDSSLSEISINTSNTIQLGNIQLKVFLMNSKDGNRGNDTLRFSNVTRKKELGTNFLMTVAESTIKDTVNFIASLNATAGNSSLRPIQGNMSVRLGGGSPNVNGTRIVPPQTDDEIWSTNKVYKSKACVCANATSAQHLTLKFDMKQHIAGTHNFYFPKLDHTYFAALRYTIDGVQQGPTMRLNSREDTLKVYHKEFALEQFVGKQFELCFEGFGILEQNFDNFRLGDATWLDNIILADEELVSNQDVDFDNELLVNVIASSSVLEIEFQSAVGRAVDLELLDLHSHSLFRTHFTIDSGRSMKSIDKKEWPKGMYFLRITDFKNGKSIIKKIIQ